MFCVDQAGAVGFAYVGRGAGPRVAPGETTQAGSNGIALYIAQGGPEVSVVQSAGKKAILPEMAGAIVQAIDILRVDQIGAAYGLG